MTIECPAGHCRHRYEDRNRSSLIGPVGADTAAVEVNRQQQSTTSCPECGQVIEFGLLMLDDDGVWRVSRFAGHADDVTVMRPPGGNVSYTAPRRQEHSAPPAGMSAAELKLRERALAVISGEAAVTSGVQRDALEVALEVGVLDEQEAAAARAWLARRPR